MTPRGRTRKVDEMIECQVTREEKRKGVKTVDTNRNSHTFHAAGSWRHRSFSNFCARHRGWHARSRWFQEGQTGTVVGTEKIGEKERPPVGTPHTNAQPLRTYDRVSNCTWLRLPRCLLPMMVSWFRNYESVHIILIRWKIAIIKATANTSLLYDEHADQ